MKSHGTVLLLVALVTLPMRSATAETSFKTPFMDLFKIFPAIDANDQAFGAIVRLYGDVMNRFFKATDAHNKKDSLLNPKIKALLVERSRAFVDLAARHDPKGDDYRAVLRRKVVEYMARSTIGMAAVIDPQISQRLPNRGALNGDLDAERAQIIAEVSVCLEQHARERL
jgi:hypothetical protein